jgi:hypothetical protein
MIAHRLLEGKDRLWTHSLRNRTIDTCWFCQNDFIRRRTASSGTMIAQDHHGEQQSALPECLPFLIQFVDVSTCFLSRVSIRSRISSSSATVLSQSRIQLLAYIFTSSANALPSINYLAVHLSLPAITAILLPVARHRAKLIHLPASAQTKLLNFVKEAAG